jgi:hypothetical protein
VGGYDYRGHPSNLGHIHGLRWDSPILPPTRQRVPYRTPMSGESDDSIDVQLRPILDDDIEAVAAFLHQEMNRRVPARDWSRGIRTPWAIDSPNHGFMLVRAGQVVGVNLAFYSTRGGEGGQQKFCNLGAFCVTEDFRSHALRLVRALLKQRGYHFTDLSPSGNVLALNRRLGFTHLDVTTSFAVNVPWPAGRGVRLTSDVAAIQAALTGPDQVVFKDHRSAPAVRHILLSEGDQQCYLITRRDRRKGLPWFATVLHVGHPGLFARRSRAVFSHILLTTGEPVTLIEHRVAQRVPAGSIRLSRTRPKMFKSATLGDADIDYLYSELTQIPW